jgi:4-amino-4-deoxy-L-arabinose transferase-like glycosyltransferase
MLGSLVGVSLIAQQLGGPPHSQVLATVVCTTIPMGILQASSSQTDYVVAFWLVCLVYFLGRLVRHRGSKHHSVDMLCVGASLGLAVLTKPTAYFIALPFIT